ncbi:MAG: PQQ-binding-like beta-propeller repeat protein [Planctomycetaceae bacterium]
MRIRSSFVTVIALALSTTAVCGGNWPDWRGPGRNSVITGSGYPQSWSEKSNVLWKTPLPGWGTSSPAIWGEQIYVTYEDKGSNGLVCLGRDGKERWKLVIGKSSEGRNRKASGANPSPVTDGQHVYVYFKSGDLACVGTDGELDWKINLQARYGADRLNWDLGTSPVLTDHGVLVAVMHAGPSYVVSLDKRTGQELWKQDRDLGAPAESRDSYSTPCVIQSGEHEIAVVLGADHVTAYRADNGSELWRVGGLNPDDRRNFRSIASPVVSDRTVIAPYARGGTLTSIQLGGQGDVTGSHVDWTLTGASADVPTPVAFEGRVYLCGDRGDVTCVEIKSGKLLWTERLPRNRYPYSSSPLIVAGHLYLTREDGTTFVLALGDKPKLVSTNILRENTYATPAFADGRLFMRTSTFLFCIGDKANEAK